MLHKAFIKRQLSRSKKQSVVFVLCVVLSLVTLIALSGFSESVHESLLKDARRLHAGDIIIRSHSELSKPLADAVASLVERGTVASARTYEFYSVVRSMAGDLSLLANLKVVEKGYPFYGEIELKSGRSFAEILTEGSMVVEEALLDGLHLGIGDRVHVGSTVLKIADVALHEPDRPVNIYSLGPRIFIAAEDLDALDLVKKGSRIELTDLLKVRDEQNVDRIASDLRAIALKDQERVETFRTAESGVKRFFDNFLFFLTLIGIFTLMLAGIGIQSALASFLKEKEQTIAIVKTLGATSWFVTLQYIIVLGVLGLVGTLIGLWLGFALQNYLPVLFQGLLPQNVKLVLSWRAVLEGLSLGIFMVVLFTLLPLYSLRDLRPSAIFRKEESGVRKGAPYYLVASAIFLLFAGMAFWRLRDVKIGLWFLLGVVALLLISTLFVRLILFLLKKIRPGALIPRQALRGLFRPRNATGSIIITLTASLSVIFCLSLLEQNLDASFVQSYPADAPNVFFLDIQPSQLEDFSKALGIKAEYYPVVRSRMTSINGEPIDRQKERLRKGDNLSREFNLTYRSHLLEDETLVQGSSLFRDDWGDDQVSVLDTVVEMRKMAVGDRISFKIQGVPLEARISSIRARTRQFIQPFFYFVFPEKTLKDAPQTIFTAVNVEKEQISGLRNRIVFQFPNVTVIDVTETVSIFSNVMHKLSRITRFFTLFSIIAGILLIISSVLATRFARIQEAVYYKILGARGSFVLKIFTLENVFIGSLSAGLGIMISQTVSWVISRRVLDIPYRAFPALSLGMALGTVLLVVVVGLLSSLSILRQRPVVFLREQRED